ncbi:MAG: hypothetical protein ABL872_09100, partial [Lacibacter sp.]
QYPFTDEGEVCLQFFMLANGRISFPVLITVFFGALTMPEYYRSFRTAYRKGKLAADLQNMDWFSIMELPLCVVQEQINGKSPVKQQHHD